MGNPWVFKKGYKPSNKEKLETLTKHAELAEKFYGKKGFMTVRKHLAWYCKGIENSKALRTKLVQANNAKDVEILIKSYLEG
jgi:tRNA-dihydrouridine synthase